MHFSLLLVPETLTPVAWLGDTCPDLPAVVFVVVVLLDPMDSRTPGFPAPHHLPEFVQFISIALVTPSNHLILCRPLFLLPSIFLFIRELFSNESALQIRGPKYWSFNFSISPFKEYSGLISFKIDWFDLLAFQGTQLLNVASWMWVTGVGAYSLSHPLFFSCFRQGHSHKSQLWSWDVLGMAKQYALDNFVDSLLLFSYEKKKKIHPVWITVF